jgi:hypothetical protein
VKLARSATKTKARTPSTSRDFEPSIINPYE